MCVCDTQIIFDSVFAVSTDTSFNTFSDSMSTLIQLFVGEGWHEVMYANILATGFEFSYYFIFYIIMISLFVSNLLTSVILSSMAHNNKLKIKDKLHNTCYNADFNTFHKEYQKEMQTLIQQQNDINLKIKKLHLLYQRRKQLKKTHPRQKKKISIKPI